jgi:hypothetical protein
MLFVVISGPRFGDVVRKNLAKASAVKEYQRFATQFIQIDFNSSNYVTIESVGAPPLHSF